MHIVMIGATGLVGSDFLNRILKNENIEKVTSISRYSLDLNFKKITEVILPEMTVESIENLELSGDVFFCALGTTMKMAGSREVFRSVDQKLVVGFSQLAKQAQAKGLFIVSSLGANKNSPIFYNRVKGEMEAEVSSLELSSTYFLHPSLLIGERRKKRFAEELAMRTGHILEKVLPSWISEKLGTKVDKLTCYVEKELFELKPGVNTISRF